MAIHFSAPRTTELKPRIVVFGVGGAGGNAVNNMIEAGLEGVEFVVANTDAQQLAFAKTDLRIQLGVATTQGLGAGAHPEIGMTAAEESALEIGEHLDGCHMVFITAGMGGGTGTGAAPIIAKCARERGILTVGVVTKPFHFEGRHRMRLADAGIGELHPVTPLEMERLGHHAHGQDAAFAGAFGDDGGGAGAGAPAHAGGDEHHVASVEVLADLECGLFGGGHADLGMRPCPQALGGGDAELDALVGLGEGELLGVGVRNDELDPLQPGLDHVVDGVAARAADTEDDDAGLQLSGARRRKMNGH